MSLNQWWFFCFEITSSRCCSYAITGGIPDVSPAQITVYHMLVVFACFGYLSKLPGAWVTWRMGYRLWQRALSLWRSPTDLCPYTCNIHSVTVSRPKVGEGVLRGNSFHIVFKSSFLGGNFTGDHGVIVFSDSLWIIPLCVSDSTILPL